MTRQNLCPNPAAKNNTTGYSGSAAIARVTDLPAPCPRATGIRVSGGGYIATPIAVCAPGDVFTVSFYGHNGGSFSESDKTVYVSYTQSAGGDLFPQTFTFALGAIGNVARASFTTAAAPANATGIYLVWDAVGVGYGMTSLLFEKVGALADYADGDSSGWVWDGADGNSTSSESAAVPAEGAVALGLDLAVAATGGRASSALAGVGLDLALSTAGQSPAAGVAALTLGLALDSTGARTSAGEAGVNLALAPSASGARSADGSVAVGLNLAVSAAGVGDLVIARSGHPRVASAIEPSPIASSGPASRILSTTQPQPWEV